MVCYESMCPVEAGGSILLQACSPIEESEVVKEKLTLDLVSGINVNISTSNEAATDIDMMLLSSLQADKIKS